MTIRTYFGYCSACGGDYWLPPGGVGAPPCGGTTYRCATASKPACQTCKGLGGWENEYEADTGRFVYGDCPDCKGSGIRGMIVQNGRIVPATTAS